MPDTDNTIKEEDLIKLPELIDMPELGQSDICKMLYESFKSSITSSQDSTNWSEHFKKYVEIQTSNMSYNLASPIANAIGSGGPTEPQKEYFLNKGGDSMIGHLNALFGFSAGEKGQVFLKTVTVEEGETVIDKYISVETKLQIDSSNLYINENQLFNYYTNNFDESKVLEINNCNTINFLNANLITKGTLSIGDEDKRFYVSGESFTYQENDIYHAGNSNKSDVDWTMFNSNVYGNLSVEELSNLKGFVTSLGGVQFNYNDKVLFLIGNEEDPENIEIYGYINIAKDKSIKFSNKTVLHNIPGTEHIQLCNTGGDIILGKDDDGEEDNNGKIRLYNTLTTEQADHDLIDRYGNASFMNTIEIGFGFGDVLMSTAKESVIIHDKLRFRDEIGPYLKADLYGILSHAKYVDGEYEIEHDTSINIGKTITTYPDLTKRSESVFINTTTDFFMFNKPIESNSYLGIQESETRLYENMLHFSSISQLVGISDGIKHYGNSYFGGNLSSLQFSTGFAGEGWCIRKLVDTGNIELTTDELLVRKKLRVYELEVQNTRVINGSFWVSDSCSGDKVEVIN